MVIQEQKQQQDQEQENQKPVLLGTSQVSGARSGFTPTNPSSRTDSSSVSLVPLLVGIGTSLILLVMAVGIGLLEQHFGITLSLVATSLLLETLIGAGVSIPMGFTAVPGAVIPAIANLVPVPLILTSLDTLIRRFGWLRRKFQKVQKKSTRYEKYGFWVLAALTPFLGAYVAALIGTALRWRSWRVFTSVAVGNLASAFFVTLGGHALFH